MSVATAIVQPITSPDDVVYPDDDGNPMSNNTLQFEWIVTIEGGLESIFADRDDVFVAGSLLWYAVRGKPRICTAPDTLVVFGRPKGYRGSYKQWEEGGIAPQVVFEVLSPKARHLELVRKFGFYQRYGVEEYYVFDPDAVELTGWHLVNGFFEEIPDINAWTSPRLGIRIELGERLRIIGPDGRPFATYSELAEQRRNAEHALVQAEQARAEVERNAAAQLERLREQLKSAGIEPKA
jgi:Uma2 family endonuclease